MKQEVVLITGCSSGVGRNLCTNLQKRGYRVVASARNINSISDLDSDMKVELDVTNADMIKQAVTKVIERYGKIDILINNAGYSVRSAVEEIDIDMAKKMFDVNVFGIIRITEAVVPYMREQHYGKIINIGSISGRLTGIINAGYCASKHAVEAISEASRYELKNFGIQVTVLEPGAMDTDFFKTLSKNSDDKMENSASPYYALYKRDINFRSKQKRADISRSVEQMVKIIDKNKLKARYTISLSAKYSVLVNLPNGLKEKIILKFN